MIAISPRQLEVFGAIATAGSVRGSEPARLQAQTPA